MGFSFSSKLYIKDDHGPDGMIFMIGIRMATWIFSLITNGKYSRLFSIPGWVIRIMGEAWSLVTENAKIPELEILDDDGLGCCH